MAEQDEVQIKLGISLQGVEASQTKARDVQQRTQVVKREVADANETVNRVEHRLEHFGLHGMKTAARAAIIGSMAIALDDFLPHEEQSAWSAISRIGASAISGGLYGAMTGNPAAAGAGAVTGAIIASIELLRHSVDEDERHQKELSQKVDESQKEFDRHLQAFSDKLEQLEQQTIQRGIREEYARYLELKSVLGGS
jgi:hypothetical protein